MISASSSVVGPVVKPRSTEACFTQLRSVSGDPIPSSGDRRNLPTPVKHLLDRPTTKLLGIHPRSCHEHSLLSRPRPRNWHCIKPGWLTHVTIRYRSRLHHIGLGNAYAGWRIVLLVAGTDIRIITLDGELLRHLELDPTIDYQPMA